VRLPRAKTSLYVVAFVLFLLLFTYFLLNYTRRVDGISMWPTLESGDLVVIQPVSMNEVHIGDIIVYGPPCAVLGFSVIHRVVGGNEKTGFITQGDDRITNPNTDQVSDIAKSNVTQACLIGKVVFVVPYIERLASLPYGLNYIFVILIFLVIIATELAGRRALQPAEAEKKAVGMILFGSGASVSGPPPSDWLLPSIGC
jgi:signal peptidase